MKIYLFYEKYRFFDTIEISQKRPVLFSGILLTTVRRLDPVVRDTNEKEGELYELD